MRLFSACYTVDVIGSCAFGLECNSFKEQDSPFLKYGKKVFNIQPLQQIITMFTLTFPNLSKILHLKTLPTDVAKFYYDVVSETVDYRLKNNSTRKDFLQLLLDIKEDHGDPTGETKGEKYDCVIVLLYRFCFNYLVFKSKFGTEQTVFLFSESYLFALTNSAVKKLNSSLGLENICHAYIRKLVILSYCFCTFVTIQ